MKLERWAVARFRGLQAMAESWNFILNPNGKSLEGLMIRHDLL